MSLSNIHFRLFAVYGSMSSQSSIYRVVPNRCFKNDLARLTSSNQFYFIALPIMIPIFRKYLKWLGIREELGFGWKVNLLALNENNPRSGLMIYFINNVIHYRVTPP